MKLEECKIGMQVKVIGNSCSHGYPKDAIHTITQIKTDKSIYLNNNTGCYIYAVDIEPAIQKTDKEKLQEQLVKAEANVDLLKNKLAFMEEAKADSFNELQFKAFSVLKLIKEETDDVRKSELITELIK